MGIEDPIAKREYQKHWIASRRKAFFSGKICRNCNGDNNLEIHHRDPKNKISNRIWSWSWERIYEEAGKCDILCYNCHVKETNKDKGKHGSRSMYYAGCKCKLCRYWKKTHRG